MFSRSTDAAADDSPHRPLLEFVHGPRAAWLILFVSLVLTGLGWQLSVSYLDQRARERFHFDVEGAEFAIRERMQVYSELLRGAAGLFEVLGEVSRKDWQTYVATLQIDHHFAGVQAIGFSPRTLAANKRRHEEGVRAEGFPEYRIEPGGLRDEYQPIVYLEPFSQRNVRSFGYDMMIEPVRRAAQASARDTGQPVLSGKVTLVQETDLDVQAGAVLYLPLYSKGAKSDTVAERRDALIGYVFSPFRMNDLMRGILGRDISPIEFRIFDGPELNDTALFFDSTLARGQEKAAHQPAHASTKQVNISGRAWTLVFVSTPQFETANADSMPGIIAAGGLAVDLVLLYVIFALTRLRRTAERLAADRAAVLDRTVQLRTITDNLPVLVAYIDRDQRYRFTNEAFRPAYGLEPQSMIGRSLQEILPEETYNGTQPFVLRALAGERVSHDTRELSGRVTESTYIPQRDATGTVVGFYALAIDITARKRAEDALSEQARVLTQANFDIEQFAYIASHDLKAPLRGISLLAEWIAEELGDAAPATVTRNLARLRGRVLRMESLMESLLAYSRVGRVATSAEVVDTAKLVAAIADDLGPHPGFTVENAGPLPVLRTGIAPLDAVLRNLISNALQHHDREAGRVIISAASDGAFVTFGIADDGPGIAPEHRVRVFQMFQTLAPTSDGAGSGIGLALVKRLVQQAGGRIEIVESGGDRGATFEFTWPIEWQVQGELHATTDLPTLPPGGHADPSGRFDDIHATDPHPAG
ncbi:MAG: CHASE domain-containing protein [Burkholderiales bacterium]